MDHQNRAVELEDLLPIGAMVRFYDANLDLSPEEVRWRAGAWRIVPKGPDKEVLASWAAQFLDVSGCERLIYVLCMVRKREGFKNCDSGLSSPLVLVNEPAQEVTTP